jgi:hypothetical protein
MGAFLQNQKITGGFFISKLDNGVFDGAKIFNNSYAGDPLVHPALLDGIYGSGVWNANAVTFTNFGTASSVVDKWVSGCAIGGGKALVLPCATTQPAIIDAEAMTVTTFGTTSSLELKWTGCVYAGGGVAIGVPGYGQNRFAKFDTNARTWSLFGNTFTGGYIKFFGGCYTSVNTIVAIPSDYARPVVIDTSANTTTAFGTSDSGEEKYRGGVYVGDGQVVAIPFNSTQPMLIDVNERTTLKFGTADSVAEKYHGGVYLGDKKVLAIPFNSTQPAIIDAAARTITKFGATDNTSAKYGGGVYIGNGKVIAMICNETRFAMIDTVSRTVTPFGANFSSAWYYHYSGIYTGNGKIVCPPFDEATQFRLIDLGQGFRSNYLNESTLLSAWLNKQ